MQILNTQFDRDYLLTFKNAETGTIFQTKDLRCSFDIEMYVDNKSKTNKGTVSVYNLTDDTVNKISTRFGKILLEAGYKGNIKGIVEGDVVNVKTTKQGSDRVTVFELAPNFINTAIKPFSFVLPENTKLSFLIKGVATALGLALPNSNKKQEWEDIVIPYGYPVYGTGKQVLDEIASCYSVEWRIQDGILYVTDRYGLNNSKRESAIVLNKNTGLIDIPYISTEEVSKSIGQALEEDNEQLLREIISLKKDGTPRKKTKYKARRYGVKVNALLNPAVKPNSLFKIETGLDQVDGYYRVRSVKFKGDTRGNEWYMELYGDSFTAEELE